MKLRLTVSLVSVCLAVASATALAATENKRLPAVVEFNRDVRPIFADTCFKCHGPDASKRKGKLRLDTREGAFSNHEGVVPFVPGDLAKSEAWRRINATNSDDLMPPAESGIKLTAYQIKLLGLWIKQGAKFSEHWAFIPPVTPPLPKVRHTSWPKNQIDYFILARLEEEGLRPSKEANKTTLIRRVTLDLTGLPPTPEEVDAFLNDKSANAYEKVVDRLLRSPHYGERMAVDWLDASRFADTHGFHIDSGRDMTRWRQWVIDAFNNNEPFDRFTIEQLAGDLLPNATLDQKIASGFNRNNMINFEGGAIPEEYHAAYIIDRVNTTTTVWLGLTAGCAQCHDHKYDPISQKDYYRLFAFFNNVPEKGLDGANGNAEPLLPLVNKSEDAKLTKLKADLAKAESDLKTAENEAIAAQQKWESESNTNSAAVDTNAVAATNKPAAEAITNAVVSTNKPAVEVATNSIASTNRPAAEAVTNAIVSTNKPTAETIANAVASTNNSTTGPAKATADSKAAHAEAIQAILSTPVHDRTKKQERDLKDYFLKHHFPQWAKANDAADAARKAETDFEKTIPTTMVMVEDKKPHDTFVLMRGQYDQHGEKVTPAVPAFMPALPPDAPANRLGLAEWLVSPKQPLTSRVVVNRYWQLYFGTGIVKTVEDFGSQGEWPSHPELLDWLATEFVRSGWDVRKMQKLIVMSATYRQTSYTSPKLAASDPENRLLARGPRFRLQAEFIRDQALAVSGLLDDEIAGKSVSPYQPPGLWEELMSREDGAKWTAQTYTQSHGSDLYRRTMYTFWKRTSPPPTLSTFDAPDRETCTVRRPRTNTPLQALVLMNDPTYLEASRKLAERMMLHANSDADRVVFAYRLLLARAPQKAELGLLLKLYGDQLARYRANNSAALKLLAIGESKRDAELDAAELAAWTMVASAILNLDETVTKG